MGLGPAAALRGWAASLSAQSASRFFSGGLCGGRPPRSKPSGLSLAVGGFLLVPDFLSPRRQSSPLLVNSACEQVAEAHLGSASMSARSLRPRRLHACPKLRPPCPAAPRQGLSPEDPRRSPLRSRLCAALHG